MNLFEVEAYKSWAAMNLFDLLFVFFFLFFCYFVFISFLNRSANHFFLNYFGSDFVFRKYYYESDFVKEIFVWLKVHVGCWIWFWFCCEGKNTPIDLFSIFFSQIFFPDFPEFFYFFFWFWLKNMDYWMGFMVYLLIGFVFLVCGICQKYLHQIAEKAFEKQDEWMLELSREMYESEKRWLRNSDGIK